MEPPRADTPRYEALPYEPGAPEGARGWFVREAGGVVLADFYGTEAGINARAFAELMNRTSGAG